LTSGFFQESVSPSPIKAVSKIENSQLKVHHRDTGDKWKKSSITKVLIILFGHLWEVELTYRYIFAFKFTSRPQQQWPICRWRR
jgi:hypothetical protein